MKNNRHFTDALFEEFDYLNDEIDNLLTEDLDAMLKYYNNLQNWDKQELLNFLTKDPTWNNNKEQGQYSKWILDKLNRNLLNSSHLGHLHDVLQRFEDNKKHLRNRDINKFKSIQEIDTYLNDDNNYNELSHSQIVRQHRKDKQNVNLDNEAELIYEDSDWEIWIPKTYAASCKLGQGSKWCTASTETSSYFDNYSKKGPLYIILNKHNNKEKYQFQPNTNSYMDINDKTIEALGFDEAERTKKLVKVLRHYDKHFGNQWDNIINKAKEAREEVNNFLQKFNSIEIIKYPTQKDIFKEINKIWCSSEYKKYLTKKDVSKINNIKLEIENSVEGIESGELKNIIASVKHVIFEKNSKVRHIDNGAFYDYINLKSIEIPDSVTSIGSGAFVGCKRLTNITIPESVTSIGESAFSRCSSLKSIEIPESVTSISDYAFYDCDSLTNITISKSVTSIGDSAFSDCTSLTNIAIPESVTSIGFCAFRDCSSLTNIEIPDSVASIDGRAFENCKSLESIVIPHSVTNIENSTFSDCYSLTSIVIPNSVTSIGKNAFEDCVSLTSIVIPDGVTSIGEEAFYNCRNLTSIVIPNSVTSIGDDAFYRCPNLVIKTSNPYVINYCIENIIKYEKIE